MTQARQEKLTPEQLDDEQRAVYESITGGPRAQGPRLFPMTDAAGALEGPFNAMLLSPPFGAALEALGRAVRFRGGLTDRAREIAILVVGYHWHSDFEIYAHEAIARSVGLSESELQALRAENFGAFGDEYEQLTARTASALAGHGDLSDTEYEAAVQSIGARTLFELTTLVGYYALLALQLRTYRVQVPNTTTGQ